MMMHQISWSRNKVERKRERVKENKDKQIRKEEKMIYVTNLQLSFAHPPYCFVRSALGKDQPQD